MEIDNTKKCYLVFLLYYHRTGEIPYTVFKSREEAEKFILSAPIRMFCEELECLHSAKIKDVAKGLIENGMNVYSCPYAEEEFGRQTEIVEIGLFKKYPDKTFIRSDNSCGYRIVEVDYFV